MTQPHNPPTPSCPCNQMRRWIRTGCACNLHVFIGSFCTEPTWIHLKSEHINSGCYQGLHPDYITGCCVTWDFRFAKFGCYFETYLLFPAIPNMKIKRISKNQDDIASVVFSLFAFESIFALSSISWPFAQLSNCFYKPYCFTLKQSALLCNYSPLPDNLI